MNSPGRRDSGIGAATVVADAGADADADEGADVDASEDAGASASEGVYVCAAAGDGKSFDQAAVAPFSP